MPSDRNTRRQRHQAQVKTQPGKAIRGAQSTEFIKDSGYRKSEFIGGKKYYTAMSPDPNSSGAGGDVTINPNGAAEFVLAGNSGNPGKLVLGADTDDTGSFSASFRAGVLTESTDYVLPLAYATTTGFVLSSTDAGVLSWAEVAGGTSWQAVVTGATQTAVAGKGYPINTTAQACTVTLPAGSVGDEVSLLDYARTFDTNNLTVASNGSEKIYASTDNLTVSVEGAAFTLVYVDSTQGWLLKDN